MVVVGREGLACDWQRVSCCASASVSLMQVRCEERLRKRLQARTRADRDSPKSIAHETKQRRQRCAAGGLESARALNHRCQPRFTIEGQQQLDWERPGHGRGWTQKGHAKITLTSESSPDEAGVVLLEIKLGVDVEYLVEAVCIVPSR